MERVLPKGFMNPGPFNHKEHTLIYVMTSGMGANVYALYNVIGQKYQLYQDLNLGWAIVFVIVTQCFGYSFAGLARRYLVRPAAMLWPSNLGTIAMLNSLHGNSDPSNGRYPMSRFKFFWLATSAALFYHLLPQYAMPWLGAISVICFFARGKADNKVALALGSAQPGAGVGFLSFGFDWTQFNSYFFPITSPLWAIVNQFVGTWVIQWVLVPLAWYFNFFGSDTKIASKSAYGFALNSNGLFNLNGTQLDKKEFVSKDPNDPKSLILNQAFYDTNKPVLISTLFAITYMTSFAVFVAAIVHVALWYGKDIWHRFRSTMSDLDKNDIHCQLMDAYDEVPDWWYYVLLVVMTILGITVCEVGGFSLPWWGVIIAVVLALASIIPIGTIQALTGQQIGLNVMSEFLIGLILPGRIAAVMAFKTLSYMAMNQGLTLVQDLKLGHYLKVPPRSMFIAQLFSQIVGAIISTVVACAIYESFGQIPPLKGTEDQYPWGWQWKLQRMDSSSGWTSQAYNTFLSAGAIWGAIGPARFFGPDSPYFKTLLGFAIGLILPVIPWLLHKVQPDSFWHLVNFPVVLIMINEPGINQAILITPFLIAIIVNYFVKKYRHMWWKKYAYVLSAALDAGGSITVVLVFFIAKYQPNIFPAWWGNSSDPERCLPDINIICGDRANMGNGYGYTYDGTQDPECAAFQ
ncbi:OPT oligopeptide transporter protein-domain-containing protein [Chytriomyces sp. MP71]|nr:OPT oligopeptide transporter protein-domain-containing protein [Chytriomyces sp. MP71]